MNIILGIISQFFESFSDAYRKKSLDNSTLGKNTFAIPGPVVGGIIVYGLILFIGSKFEIFSDYKIIGFILIIAILEIITNYLYMYVYKNIQISQLLPYDNLDKLLVVVIGFFIFTGEEATSLITLGITIFTIIIITLFSIDFKTLKISRNILLYIIALSLNAITTLMIGSILLDYSAVDYMSINVFIMFILYGLGIYVFKESVRELLTQKKEFYKPKIYAMFLGWASFLIGLYIIENAGVIVATLISFLAVITSIISYKIILNDTPDKKEIILAFLVTILIGIGYYYK